ncbi:MAG: glycosyltransferase [Acidimicrobiia bacterium]|nr:glycosyltransferase [Acidimicrobiia bacterium]
MGRRILIISASMGAGHDGAAHELRRRLELQGHTVQVVDFLDCCPFGIGWFIKWTYMVQLRVAPWSYELTYRLWYRMPSTWRFIVRLDTAIAGKRIRRAITDADADVVVSTYPLSSLVLGNMRKKRWLRVPVITYLTDFAVHPLWVHPHVDVHLATSEFAAATARTRGGEDARAPGPLVADRFRVDGPEGTRASARAALGLGDDARAVLVVAGSWGVGDVAGTYDAICAAGDFHPVVVCGRDDKLRKALESGKRGTILGWTDDMPSLMAACDVMVENAGGLTANEAFAAGLPVVTFFPIAGHGKDNAEGMASIGVTQYARDADELRSSLEVLSRPGLERQEQIARAFGLFASDPADDVVAEAQRRAAEDTAAPIKMPRLARRTRRSAVVLFAVYGLLTLGAQGVSAFGVGVAAPPPEAHDQVFIGVRLTADELEQPSIRAAVERLNATAIIDGRTVTSTGSAAVQELVNRDVDLGNGGWGQGRSFRPLRAETDVVKSTNAITNTVKGAKVLEFVPGRRFDAFDQIYARRRGQRLVRADHVIRPSDMPDVLRDRAVYVVDGRGSKPGQLASALDGLEATLHRDSIHAAPLSALR